MDLESQLRAAHSDARTAVSEAVAARAAQEAAEAAVEELSAAAQRNRRRAGRVVLNILGHTLGWVLRA